MFARGFPGALALIPQRKTHGEEHPPGLPGTLARERRPLAFADPRRADVHRTVTRHAASSP
ncbi:hypothetical protein EIQ10_02750 [Xanthomonas campestris pv. campestris]